MDEEEAFLTQAHRVLGAPRLSRLLQYIRSRAHAPEIEGDVIREVLGHYGLRSTGSPRNLTVSKRNCNLVVTTSGGKKVLKRYWHGWPLAVIVYEHSILSHLAELNFPATRLVTTRDDKTLVSWRGATYALFDFSCGRNYSSSRLLRAHRLRLVAAAGHTLAYLHRQLEGFVPEGRHHSGFESYTGDRWRGLAWHVDKVSELKEKSRSLTETEARANADWLIQNSGHILEELGRLEETLKGAALPRLIIHGDYGFHNLHFHDDGMVTVLDFESARLEWRLRDLVTSLARFRYTHGAFDADSIRCFTDAYQAEYPLKVEEWQLLPHVWRFCRLQDAVKYWNSYFETDGPTRKLISARGAIHQADQALAFPSELG